MIRAGKEKGMEAKEGFISRSRFTFYILLFGIAVLNGCGTPSTIQAPLPELPSKPVQHLRSEIETILDDALLASSHVGMKVVSLATGEVLYEKDADKLYHPASTMKLVTAATALVKLKPDYRFQTTLYIDRFEASGVLGNIYLKGRGDPVFTGADLEKLVDKLVGMGVKSVQGDIVVDETDFDTIRRGKGWMWDDGPFGGYFSHLSALTINHNSVLVRMSPGRGIGDSVQASIEPATEYMTIINEATTVDSPEDARLDIERQSKPIEANILTIRGSMKMGEAEKRLRVDVVDPALYCGTLLKEILAQKGVSLQGTVRHGELPNDVTEIANHISPPLSRIVWEMNKSSDNLTAELLLKTIGAQMEGTPGTAEKGRQAINEFLNEIGLDTTGYVFADGSGVSRYNLVTASMLTALLVYMFRNFAVMPEYLASLPIAGVDGTLKWRMKEMRAARVLRAKTGTMRGVTTLAGYTMTGDGERLAFAVLMSHYTGSANPRRALQDGIGDVLTQFSRKEKWDSAK
ncbi:MAG: D-alanyl-D-alanine carboxypeptidase/D-alanyl-D-alanine-endopeptidase [Candidatus Poribacteria bacterium]|nr:D-alanyl-D-alanine carboxypeptidase/D-alanyl-D-alanine-endopeptidase [Candidatus Poribacteria bacterium]